MSKLKRITAAAVCTAGLTFGALVSATPAMAAPGGANYDCGDGDFDSVDAEFDRNVGGQLVITAALPYNVPTGGVTVTSKLDGVTGPSASLPAGPQSSITLTGSFATLTAAPNAIQLTISGTPPIVVNCTLRTDYGGWNV